MSITEFESTYANFMNVAEKEFQESRSDLYLTGVGVVLGAIASICSLFAT